MNGKFRTGTPMPIFPSIPGQSGQTRPAQDHRVGHTGAPSGVQRGPRVNSHSQKDTQPAEVESMMSPPPSPSKVDNTSVKMQNNPATGRFTREDIVNGFKMSVILGEPLSRRRYGRR